MKKNYFLRLIFPILAFALLASCEEVEDALDDGDDSGIVDGDDDDDNTSGGSVSATAVSFTEEEVDIYVKESVQLAYTTEPTNATNITFESADETEVTVTEDGVVTGLAKGGAWVVIRNISGSLQDFCYVRVSEAFVSSLTFDEDTYTILIDADPTALSYTTDPEGLYPVITWLIADEEVLSIDENDLVTPLKGGESVVTAMDVNGIYYDQCTVIIKVSVESATFADVVVSAGSTANVEVSYLPVDAYPIPVFTWLSMNPAVATVEDGVVTGVGAGTATVYVNSDAGVMLGSFTVTVQ